MIVFKKVSIGVLAAVFALGLTPPLVAHAATSPTLGTADSFSILAKTLISNVPTSSIAGDVGLDNAGTNYSGLTTGEVGGTIYDTNGTGPDGVSGNNPALMTSARADNTSAYGALSAGGNAPCTVDYGAVVTDLVGQSLEPGVYCAEGAGTFELSGTLTLTNLASDPDPVWIFRSGSTLTTSGTANVVGGDACSVWWKVPSSATLGTNTSLKGNILALTSITVASGATLNGRVLAQNGAVTLDSNIITGPTCAVASSSSSSDEDDKDVDIKVVKKSNPSVLLSGPGSVTYSYTVTNPGSVSLKDVSVKDDKCSPVEYVSGDTNNNEKLGVEEEWKYTCTKRVSQTETNTATARGSGNGEWVKDTDIAHVVVSAPGFPNTGVGPDNKTYAPWSAIFPAGILVALFLFFVARRKVGNGLEM